MLTQKVDDVQIACLGTTTGQSIEVDDHSKSSQKLGKNITKWSINFFVEQQHVPLTEILEVLGVTIKAGKKKYKYLIMRLKAERIIISIKMMIIIGFQSDKLELIGVLVKVMFDLLSICQSFSI